MKKKMINHLTLNGNKETGEKIILQTLKELQKFSRKKIERLIKLSIVLSTPIFKIHRIINKKRKKKIKELPAIIRSKKSKISLAIKFILAAFKNKNSYNCYIKLKEELILTIKNKGTSVQIKNEIQKRVIFTKRLFLYYR